MIQLNQIIIFSWTILYQKTELSENNFISKSDNSRITIDLPDTRGYELWSTYEASHIFGLFSHHVFKVWSTFKLFEKWTLLHFRTNDCIDNSKWTKVYFSKNLIVDQTSLWTRDQWTVRKYVMSRKWIKVHTPRYGNISIYNFSVRLDLIIQYQEEDRNESFDEMCLFCSQKFAGGREACIEFFRHMNNTHQFNIGHPDNMVSVILGISGPKPRLYRLWYDFLFRFLWKNLLKLCVPVWKISSV